MPRPGRQFERLLAALNELENNDPSFSVQSPAFLPDKVTGQRREVDILLSYGSGNAVTRVALECKEHARKIDVKEVEAFTSKVADLDVDQMVMVSSSGYTAPAVLKAAHRGLIVQTIEQSTRYDWTHTAGVLADWICFDSFAIEGYTDQVTIPCIRMFGPVGSEITHSQVMDAVGAALLADPLDLERSEDDATERPNEVVLALRGIGAAIDDMGNRFTTPRYRVRATIRFSRSFKTLGYYQNRTESIGKPSAFARARIPGKDEFSELVLSELAPDRAKILLDDQTRDTTPLRGRVSLVTWPDLTGRLMEVKGERHHLGLSVASDLRSVHKFMHYFDNANRDGRPHDPAQAEEYARMEMLSDSGATVRNRDRDVHHYRPGPRRAVRALRSPSKRRSTVR